MRINSKTSFTPTSNCETIARIGIGRHFIQRVRGGLGCRLKCFEHFLTSGKNLAFKN